MRIDIPQDLPRRRELQPDTPRQEVSKQPEPHPVQQHIQSLKERASQYRLNHGPAPRSPSQSPQREREVSTSSRRVKDSREVADDRRTRRDRIPAQTIGMQLRPEERKTMLELGRFRAVRTGDLAQNLYDGKQRKLDEDLRYLRSKGLVETRHINLRRDGTRRQIERVEVATLTRDGRAWLNRSGEVPQGQTVYYGFVKPREIEHDSLIYRAYCDAARRIESDGGSNLRVKLDFEIKADVQRDIYRVRKADPKRGMSEIKKEVAEKQELPFVNGKIQIPDARIEFDREVESTRNQDARQDQDQGSRVGGHEDIEVLTAAYRRSHLRAKAQAGFRAYAAGADRSSISAKIEDDHDMMRDILDL
jgi:DNA-binding transcriptional ArsR family regulator